MNFGDADTKVSFLPKPANGERRWALRAEIEIRTRLNHGQYGRLETKITDFSETGCRIDCCTRLSVGHSIVIQIPGFEGFDAKIMWVNGRIAGCKFERTPHPAVRDYLIERFRPKSRW